MTFSNTIHASGRRMLLALAALAASAAMATPTVTIDSVVQRWPWNNKVDITYTVADGTDMAKVATGEKPYYKIVFTATIDGREYTIDGSKDLIAKTTTGEHTITWTNAPAGVRAANCKMGAKLYRTSAYYMIIDLDSGHFAFDGLEGSDTPTAIPTASNARYTSDEKYMTDWLVLRRVPRTAAADASYASGYPTGDSRQYATSNSETNWVTVQDYFIAIYDTTEAQYAKIMGTSPSSSVKPKRSVTWKAWRNSKRPTATLGSSQSSSSALERLNALTGLSGFDLPTEVMSEIAARAGVAQLHYAAFGSGSDGNGGLIDCTTRGESAPRAVHRCINGNKVARSNKWGLFHAAGNVYEWCRDAAGRTNMADADSPWAPYDPSSSYADDAKFRVRGGAPYDADASTKAFYVSYRYADPNNGAYIILHTGVRISFAVDQ